MKIVTKCLNTVAVVLIGMSISSTSYSAHYLGTDFVDYARCDNYGATWRAGSRVYGQVNTQCSKKLRLVTQGVKLHSIASGNSDFYVFSKANWQNFTARTYVNCIKSLSRNGWAVSHQFNTYDRVGSFNRFFDSNKRTLDYHYCK